MYSFSKAYKVGSRKALGVPPFPSGAVAYYKLDEVSGSVIDQVSANNGTNFGAVPNVAGVINTGYSFVANDYINIDPVLSAVSSATQGTWNVWAKPVDSTPTVGSSIITFGDTIASTYLGLFLLTDGNISVQAVTGAIREWDLRTDANPFTDNTWLMVTIVQDGVNPVLYVNGVEVGQTFSISTDKTIWFNNYIGIDNGSLGALSQNSAGYSNYFDGTQDEIGIWNRPLSASEIFNNLWNNGNGNPFST